MGWDTHSIFILFGIKIPDEDIIRVIQIFYPERTDITRALKIPNTSYHIVNNGGFFISLVSPRFGVGENDYPELYYEIIPPSETQVKIFLEFLLQHEIKYPYSQYLIT